MKRINIIFLIIFCAACVVPGIANALEIKKERLSNGLTVLYVERHELPIVMTTLLIKSSPLQEDPAKAGTAYITAKMLTYGTKNRKFADISREIEFIGASLESETNSDFTTVSLSVLKKDVNQGFDLLSDVALHPSFPAEEVPRKKELIKGSLRQREEEPSFVADKEFIKDVFGNNPYGRLVEGSTATIDKIGRNDIIDFYNSFYRPDNSVLVVVGDLKRDEVSNLVAKYFSGWKSTSEKKSATPPLNTAELKERKIEIIDKDIAQANIILGHVGISRDNPDFYSVQVMNYIFGGGGFASRLMRVIRDEMGLTYSINSFYAANKYPGRFEIEVQTKNESARSVIDEILKQMRLMKEAPVSDQELKDAKDYLIGSFPRRLETSRKVADFLAAVQFYNLGDNYIDKYKEYVSKVTKEDVLRVARKYMDDKNYVLVVVGNKKKMALK